MTTEVFSDSKFGRKCWSLSENETFSSFENWKRIIVNFLKTHKKNIYFLKSDTTWLPYSPSRPDRGLTADFVEKVIVTSVDEKVETLTSLLSFIASYSPSHIHYCIINESTSINAVWAIIRDYYGLRRTESMFMDFINIRLEKDERPSTLYYRILAHLRDHCLSASGDIKHNNDLPCEDEMLSPTCERLAVLF